MASITIHKIDFPDTPDSTQTLTVEYKLATASSYTSYGNITVATDGIPTESPLPTITGLTAGLLYNVRFTNNCGSPAPYWIENITA